jgi:hypothetical protein
MQKPSYWRGGAGPLAYSYLPGPEWADGVLEQTLAGHNAKSAQFMNMSTAFFKSSRTSLLPGTKRACILRLFCWSVMKVSGMVTVAPESIGMATIQTNGERGGSQDCRHRAMFRTLDRMWSRIVAGYNCVTTTVCSHLHAVAPVAPSTYTTTYTSPCESHPLKGPATQVAALDLMGISLGQSFGSSWSLHCGCPRVVSG